MVLPSVLLIFLAALLLGSALTRWLCPVLWRDDTPVTKEAASKTHISDAAVTSLWLSCASVFLGPLGFFLGILLGFQALKEIRSDSALTGIGLAWTGIMVGFLIAGVFVFFGLFFGLQGYGDM